MKQITLFIFASALFLFNSCTKKITIESLLEEMTDRDCLTYSVDGKYQLKQASSYNRESVSSDKEGWYANYDMSHFVRVERNNNRREFVLLDQDGPGAIVRWWMTFWRAENGILRVYLDKDSIPEIEGSPLKVVSGQILAEAPFSESVPHEAPENERGHNLYLPIPYSGHCKITYECDSLVAKDGRFFPDVFYNICYRKYEAGTKMETFSMERLRQIKPALDRAKEKLLADFSSNGTLRPFNQEVLPGDSIAFAIEEKGKAISWLSLNIMSPRREQALRSTVLSATFDTHQTVWVPAGEFFGTGYKLYPHKTWVNSTEKEGLMASAWKMPFQKKCRLVYINYGKDTIRLKGELTLSDYQWKPNSMYFGACWHEYHHIKTRPDDGLFFDVNYIDIKGKGLYIGDQVTLFNMANTWWGEGDEKIFVDGEKFPSSFGTGSEDYYGYAFAHPEPFSHPFISEPTGAGNFTPEMTVNMRHRSLDAIPFNTSISANIEMWHWASTCINYAMTSYFYIRPPYEKNIQPDIESVQRPVSISEQDFYSSEGEKECFSINEIRNLSK